MNFDISFDARQYTPKEKHDKLFSTIENLPSGNRMELINDHDPAPLKKYLDTEHPDKYEWEYLESGPEVWRICITRK